MEKPQYLQNEQESSETDRSERPDKGFLVGEETEDVDASGVDDKSTGMGDDDYLGTTNKKNDEDE